MTKTLVISSSTPEEDVQAAFTIMSHAESDKSLKRITWYSNLGSSLSKLNERINETEKSLNDLKKCFEGHFGLIRNTSEKTSKIEKLIAELQKQLNAGKK